MVVGVVLRCVGVAGASDGGRSRITPEAAHLRDRVFAQG